MYSSLIRLGIYSAIGSELLFDSELLALCMKYVILEFSVNWARTFTVRMCGYNVLLMSLVLQKMKSDPYLFWVYDFCMGDCVLIIFMNMLLL